ncbi:MAG TPA: type II secretion system minor pseudopilin GspK [Alphaproteobacteria bacterium]|nr:type II secretion system minor pseudopilin GspK [Alphaproteobacteria bacterium]
MIGAAQDRRGFALVVVLWLLAVIAGLAATAVAYFHRPVLALRRAEAAAAGQVASAAVARAALALLTPSEAAGIRRDGRGGWTLAIGGRRVTVTVQDEAGRIDLNTAAPELLEALFAAAGAPDPGALAAAVLDWRDEDGLRRPGGGEAEDYAARGLPWVPRNARFESVGELQRVIGMTPALHARLAPDLTVHGLTEGADPAVATPNVAALLRRRPGAAAASPGVAFTVAAALDGPDGRPVRRSAVVWLTQRPEEPFRVLAWGEGR